MSTPDKSPPLGEVLEAIERTKTVLKTHIKLMENDDFKLDSPISSVLDIYEVARDQGPKKQLLAKAGPASDDRIAEDYLYGLKG